MPFLRRNILVVFFGLTYLISWGAWGLVNVAQPAQRPLTGWLALLAILGAGGPSLAGLACAGILDGRAGVKALLGRLVAWRVSWKAYLALFLGPILLVFVPVGLNMLLNHGPAPDGAGVRRLPELLPTFLSMFLIGGLTEETGWRGFALPVMRQYKGPLVASLVLGLLWGLWHLPIYSLPALGDPLAPPALIRFIRSTPLLAILFTRLAERTDDSVWMAMLFHAWFNTAFTRLPGIFHIAEDDQLLSLSGWLMLLAVAPSVWAWLRATRFTHPMRRGQTP